MALRVFPDPGELAAAAAETVARIVAGAITAHGRAAVALSGGGTPRLLFERLVARSRAAPPAPAPPIDWTRVHLFWGDERCVPPDHPDSNYRLAAEALIRPLDVPPANVHRMPAEMRDAAAAAAAYEAELRRCFDLAPDALPRFDLVLLGLGEDGHTASLFPGTAALDETRRLVAAPWVEQLGAFRLTLTPRVLNHAGHVLVLVAGGRKAGALQAVLEGPRDPASYPAQLVEPQAGALGWLVDRAAASRLAGCGGEGGAGGGTG